MVSLKKTPPLKEPYIENAKRLQRSTEPIHKFLSRAKDKEVRELIGLRFFVSR